jgi:ribosomal protein S8
MDLPIEAQDGVKASTRAKYLEILQQEGYIEKLHQIEKVVFPTQVSLVLT